MPSNISAETATAITSLPFKATVDPGSASAHLWWKYTAQASDVYLNGFGWADDAGAYRPQLRVWRGSSPYALAQDTTLGTNHGDRVPVAFTAVAGETYWFDVSDANATEPLGAPLEFSVVTAPAAQASAGELFIPDDDSGFPGAILSPVTGEVRRFVTFPGAETADILPTGEILTYNFSAGLSLEIYDRAFRRTAHITGTPLSLLAHPLITCDHVEVFYIYDQQTRVVYTIGRDGSVGGTTWGPLPSGTHSIAVSRDGTVLYFIASITSGISRWDLVNDADLGVLSSTGVTGYSGVDDAFVFADGSFLYSYGKADGSRNFARRFAPDGTLIAEIELEHAANLFIDRMCLNSDERSFWVWYHYDPDFQRSRFSLYSMDGTLLRSFEQPQAPAGLVYVDTPVQNPTRWGHANSCPILVLRQPEIASLALLDDSIPCCPSPTKKPCQPSPGAPASPASRPLQTSTGPLLKSANTLPASGPTTPLDASYWERQCAGGGTVPTASDPVDSESWA